MLNHSPIRDLGRKRQFESVVVPFDQIAGLAVTAKGRLILVPHLVWERLLLPKLGAVVRVVQLNFLY